MHNIASSLHKKNQRRNFFHENVYFLQTAEYCLCSPDPHVSASNAEMSNKAITTLDFLTTTKTIYVRFKTTKSVLTLLYAAVKLSEKQQQVSSGFKIR